MPIERIEKDGKRTTIQGPTVPAEVLHRMPAAVQQRITGPARTAQSADFWADSEEPGAVYFGGIRIIKLVKGLEPRAADLAKELNAALRRVVDARAQVPQPKPPPPRPHPPVPVPIPTRAPGRPRPGKGGSRGPGKA
jgi:hypothetical protein